MTVRAMEVATMSIVIPTYRREQVLVDTLDTQLRQVSPAGKSWRSILSLQSPQEAATRDSHQRLSSTPPVTCARLVENHDVR